MYRYLPTPDPRGPYESNKVAIIYGGSVYDYGPTQHMPCTEPVLVGICDKIYILHTRCQHIIRQHIGVALVKFKPIYGKSKRRVMI